MDAVSANVIELLRKNSTRINVLRVKQYVGGVWQAMNAYYYDGANWTQISRTVFNPATDITYTGTMSVIDDGDGHWRVKFLTSGVLTVAQAVTIDAFLVGGGGGGGQASNTGGAGGGGNGTSGTVGGNGVANTGGGGGGVTSGGGGVGSYGGSGIVVIRDQRAA